MKIIINSEKFAELCNGRTQRAIAKKLEVSAALLNYWLREAPTLAAVWRIASLFREEGHRLTLDDLLTAEAENDKPALTRQRKKK